MLTKFFRAIFISIFFVFLLFTGLSFARTIGVYPPTNLKQNDSITAGLWFNNSDVTFWMNKPMDDGFILGTGIGVDVFNIDNSQLVESYSQVRVDDNDYALVNLQFIDGKYRWQAKTFSIFSGDSSWVQFGNNLDADMDFGIDTLAPETTILPGGPSGFVGPNPSGFNVSARGDDGTGSGVNKFRYSITGPWWQSGVWLETPDSLKPAILANPAFGSTWGLTADGTYTAEFRAVDQAGNEDLSSATRTFTLDTTPPFPPMPSATVPNSTVNSTSFSWTASTDTSSGLAGYEIERADDDNDSPNSSTWAPLASVDDATLSYTDNNLQSNTRYWYRLKAKDQVNNYSVFTTPFKIATRADAPKNGVLNAVSPSQIDISWGSGGRQDRYHVYEWDQGLICVPAITSCSHTGLLPNTGYKYNIYGVNLEGQEAGGIFGVNTVTLPKSPDISSNRIIGGSFSDSQDVEFTTNIPFGNGSLAYYNYIWDQQPTYVWGSSLPSTWQNLDGLKLTLPANAHGSWYLHIRSMNSAGQPGEGKDLGSFNYNQAPVADAGGSYNIIWGDNLSLNGSKSTDLDGDPLVFEWDLNNDNTFGEVAGEKPVVNFAQQQAWFTGAGIYTIRLRVRDSFGLTHIGSTLVNIAANAPPQQISNPTQPIQPIPLSNTFVLLSAKPKVIKAGLWAKIAGKVRDSLSKALAKVKVILKVKVLNKAKGKGKSQAIKAKWKTLGVVTTNAKGEFVYKHKPKQTTIYKAQFGGNTLYSASSSKEVKVTVNRVKKKAKKKAKKR